MAILLCPTTSILPFLLMTLLLGISANLSPTLVTGHLITFTCTSLSFYTQQVITITWFKDGKKSQTLLESFSSSQSNNLYNITRKVQVPFTGSNVQSQVICEVKPRLSIPFHTLTPQRDPKNNSVLNRGPLTTAAPEPFLAKKTQPQHLLLIIIFLGWKILLLVALFAHFIYKKRLV